MELGAIGELVGGVAVVASLLFVGIQVRGSAKGQKASAIDEATRETANLVQYFGEPGRAEIWLQGMSDYESLGAPDRLRFSSMLLHFFRMFEQLYHHSRGNDVDADLWRGFERQLRDFVAYPGFAGWWHDRGHWFGDRFRSFVQSHMNEANPPRAYETWTREA